MSRAKVVDAWAVEWDHKTGGEEWTGLQWSPEQGPGDYRLFRSRSACRAYIEMRYGYIRRRADLRQAPHCWRMPRAVRVRVSAVH